MNGYSLSRNLSLKPLVKVNLSRIHNLIYFEVWLLKSLFWLLGCVYPLGWQFWLPIDIHHKLSSVPRTILYFCDLRSNVCTLSSGRRYEHLSGNNSLDRILFLHDLSSPLQNLNFRLIILLLFIITHWNQIYCMQSRFLRWNCLFFSLQELFYFTIILLSENSCSFLFFKEQVVGRCHIIKSVALNVFYDKTSID